MTQRVAFVTEVQWVALARQPPVYQNDGAFIVVVARLPSPVRTTRTNGSPKWKPRPMSLSAWRRRSQAGRLPEDGGGSRSRPVGGYLVNNAGITRDRMFAKMERTNGMPPSTNPVQPLQHVKAVLGEDGERAWGGSSTSPPSMASRARPARPTTLPPGWRDWFLQGSGELVAKA